MRLRDPYRRILRSIDLTAAWAAVMVAGLWIWMMVDQAQGRTPDQQPCFQIRGRVSR